MTFNKKISISIIIPCYNEADNIAICHKQIDKQLSPTGKDYECIFVDDGSTDNTLTEIKKLCTLAPNVKYVSFSRNFGHQKALRAGLDMAQGEAVITMDADLQHPASLLPEMLSRWNEGYEVVNTRRTEATETNLFKRSTSALFYRLLNFLTDMEIHPGTADFRLTDRKVTNLLCKCRENDLFLRGMVSWCGFRQTTIQYQAANRHAGKTKYSLRRMIELALDGITSFTIRPLRLAILLSVIFILLSMAETGYVCYVAFFTDQSVSGWASLAILISVLGAMTLLMLGIIGEYVGRTFIQGKQRPLYVVRETNILS
ncbi:MAG: glycosyltransferase family 2 protein [Paraprevotella sp.]|nr:glycosyltransferase family 2 protein [Paraprevotella sp.]